VLERERMSERERERARVRARGSDSWMRTYRDEDVRPGLYVVNVCAKSDRGRYRLTARHFLKQRGDFIGFIIIKQRPEAFFASLEHLRVVLEAPIAPARTTTHEINEHTVYICRALPHEKVESATVSTARGGRKGLSAGIKSRGH